MTNDPISIADYSPKTRRDVSLQRLCVASAVMAEPVDRSRVAAGLFRDSEAVD
ncbi:MAG: hypothetical protein R3E09_06715 [Novosphingobium sp.]